MPALRIGLSLLAVVVLHALGTRLAPGFPAAVDLFLVFVVTVAGNATPLRGTMVGMFAGLTADALSGGPYGLNGFANTLVGYGVATLVGRLSRPGLTGAMLIYAAAAALQLGVLVALSYALLGRSAIASSTEVLSRVATAAGLGLVLTVLRRRLASWLGRWEERRSSRLRFGR